MNEVMSKSLSNVTLLKFEKGEKKQKLFYKTRFAEEHHECDSLTAKAKQGKLAVPSSKNSNQGLQAVKRGKIIKDLVPLMPDSRTQFWQNLYQLIDSVDLLGSIGDT